ELGGGRSREQGEDGEAAVLRQGGREEGPVDSGGGPEARRIPPHPRPLLLARCPQARRVAEVRQELPAPVDKLPEARPQAGTPRRRRRAPRHRPPRAARQQVVQDRGAAAGEDRQRDQEPLEHHIRKKLLRMGIDPVTHLPLQEQDPAATATPPPPPPQHQEHQQPPSPPAPQQHQQPQSDGDLLVIQPHEIATPPPPAPPIAAAGSNCGSASSASGGGSAAASVVSPSCSSSASAPAAHGVEATEWPEPMYLFGMDGIMDAGWDGLFTDAGDLSGGVGPFDGCYPGGGFDQDDGWM
ncbi:unnamed protein product, partial [Urochloa humidicola]